MSKVTLSPAELQRLEDSLLNTSGKVALHNRFRALFTLKALKSQEAVDIISKGLSPHFISHCPVILIVFRQGSLILLLC